jgi:hypothetical protein
VRARAEVAAGTRSLRVSAEVWRRRIIIRSGTGFAVGKKLYRVRFYWVGYMVPISKLSSLTLLDPDHHLPYGDKYTS